MAASAAELIKRLGLQPLPGEGGHWAPGARSSELSSIFYLLTPSGFSALHRLTVTEGWQWLDGAPAALTTLGAPGATTQALELGRPALVPAGVWQGARTLGEWTLVSCWCAPRYTDDCFTLGWRDDLITDFPGARREIERLTRHPHG